MINMHGHIKTSNTSQPLINTGKGVFYDEVQNIFTALFANEIFSHIYYT
jgi:hypothetical protein